VFDTEENRLKKLLISSIFLYFLSWVLGLGVLNRILNDIETIGLFLDYQWVFWIMSFFIFMWIPVSLWLLVQGILLRKQMITANYGGDKSISTLAIVIPLTYWIIYILSRILNIA
jgi:hypothetical protein